MSKTTPVYRSAALVLKVDAETITQAGFDLLLDEVQGEIQKLLAGKGLEPLPIDTVVQHSAPDRATKADFQKEARQEMKKLQHRLLVNISTAIEKAFERHLP